MLLFFFILTFSVYFDAINKTDGSEYMLDRFKNKRIDDLVFIFFSLFYIGLFGLTHLI
jgi:hypothetical protein